MTAARSRRISAAWPRQPGHRRGAAQPGRGAGRMRPRGRSGGIWEKLAGGPKPYAPAMAQLGYVAWKGGDVVRAETLFNRAVESDKLLGSVSARLNLAQILRDKARRISAGGARAATTAGGRAPARRAGTGRQQPAGLLASATSTTTWSMLEMARLVGTQAIARAEEIATGKFAGGRDEPAEGKPQPARRARGRPAEGGGDGRGGGQAGQRGAAAVRGPATPPR